MSSFLLFSSRGWSLLMERSRDLERLRDRSRWPVGEAFAAKRSARAASRAPKSGSGAATSAMAAGAGTSKRDFLAGAGAGAAAADIPKVAEPQSSSAASDAGAATAAGGASKRDFLAGAGAAAAALWSSSSGGLLSAAI